MATNETTVTVHARATHDRDALFVDGVTGAEDSYGKVQVVRTTVTQRYSEESTGRRSGRNKIGEPDKTVEVLADLDVDDAALLVRSLTNAIVDSLQVKPGYRDRTKGS